MVSVTAVVKTFCRKRYFWSRNSNLFKQSTPYKCFVPEKLNFMHELKVYSKQSPGLWCPWATPLFPHGNRTRPCLDSTGLSDWDQIKQSLLRECDHCTHRLRRLSPSTTGPLYLGIRASLRLRYEQLETYTNGVYVAMRRWETLNRKFVVITEN